MRFKELMKNNGYGYVKRLSEIGGVSFNMGRTDKGNLKTPHYAINKCIEMFEDISIVRTGIEQLAGFIFPNKNIKISSSDPKTVKFLENWYSLRSGAPEEIRNILQTNLICGNAPMEKRWIKAKNKDGTMSNVFDNFFSFNNMSLVYVNMEDMEGDSAYIIQLPVGTKSFYFMGEVHTPAFYKVTYMQQYQFVFKQIYGISIPHWKFALYKTGWSRDNIYGSSPLASAIDDGNIMNNIKSSWDTISKTRQIDRKILTPDVKDMNSVNIDQDKLDALGEELENSDKSFSLLSIPLKLVSNDIEVSGKYDLMEGVYDLLRRNLQTALLPNVLTPWSDTATTQGSEVSMPPFMSRLVAKQNEFIHWLNENVIGELRKHYTWLAEDATHVFDKPKIMGDEYYIRLVGDLISTQIMTSEQGKKYLLDIGVLDADIFELDKKTSSGFYKYGDGLDKDEKESLKKNLTEKVSDGFASFRSQLNIRHAKKPFSTSGWEEVYYKELGGHEIRLVQDSANKIWLLFDGLNFIEAYEDDVVSKKGAKTLFDEYVEVVRKSFEEFDNEETKEDVLIDELETEVQKEIEERLAKLFKNIGKNEVKKEGFLSANFLKKFDDVFSGFNAKINSIVSKTLGKVGVSIIEEDETLAGKPEQKTINMLKDKNKLLTDSLKSQVKTTSDKMLADIKTNLATGIAAGKDVKDIKSETEKQFNYENGVGWKFTRSIFTGSRSAAGLLRLKKYQQMGFEKFIWITREDSRVRPEHAKRNKKVYLIKDALEGRMPYPGGSTNFNKHPNFNCRCMARPF